MLHHLLRVCLVLRSWLDHKVNIANTSCWARWPWDSGRFPACASFISLFNSLDVLHDPMSRHFFRELALRLLFAQHSSLTLQLVKLNSWLSRKCLWREPQRRLPYWITIILFSSDNYFLRSSSTLLLHQQLLLLLWVRRWLVSRRCLFLCMMVLRRPVCFSQHLFDEVRC